MPLPETRRLLKAESVRGLGSKVVFNFDDLRERCDAYIEQTRAQAVQIVGDAQAQAQEIRQRAQTEASAAGRAAGLAQASGELEQQIQQRAEKIAAERLSTALPAFTEAARMLAAERDHWLAHWESSAVHLSIAIAEQVIRQKLERSPEVALEIITEALKLAAGAPQIRLRLNPRDVATIGPLCNEALQRVAPAGGASIVGDEAISPGGGVVETQHGRVDAQIESQLERIASELLPQDF